VGCDRPATRAATSGESPASVGASVDRESRPAREPPLLAPEAPVGGQPTTAPAPVLPAIVGDRACLPLVANGDCVLPCSPAVRDGAGVWRLTFWQRRAVRIERRCDDGGCSDVLAFEMPMGGECMPRFLDADCHLEGNACVGLEHEAGWPPR
jgi:hypothetical protein